MRPPAPSDPFFRLACAVAGWATRYHRATLEGADRLPAGPALLVGNHGIFGLETPVFFHLVREATGRLPRGLADRVLFGNAVVRPLLERCGSAVGTPENALRLLREGHLVVCYPGGAREVFKAPEGRYRLRWERSRGFCRVAIQAQVPVFPFAGIGVDATWVNLGHLPGASALLGRYSVPLALGLGPLPLPAKLRFVVGEPIAPPRNLTDSHLLKARVQAAVEDLLRDEKPDAFDAARPAAVLP